MHRPRPIVISGGIVAAVALLPLVAAVALAADPTVVVRPGDTLTAISKRHGVSIDQLVALNALSDPDHILAGQRLQLARSEGSAPAAAAPAAPAQVHVVQPGENLTWIARRYGVTVAAIASANAISDPSRIVGGQRLAIPGPAERTAVPAPAPATTTSAAAQVHVVQPGENLTWIARRYGVTVAAIASANAISDPSRIFGGQRLTIPGATSRATSAPPVAMPASMAPFVAARDDVRRIITEEAARYGVPAPLALAVAWQESGWRQGVVSSAGAIGVMQLLPTTAEWVGQSMLGVWVDIHDARQNARAGVRLLAHYLDRYGGNRDLVLAAYYQGQNAVDRHGVYAVSRPYIDSILALERIFGR